jgi:hypothetical protein
MGIAGGEEDIGMHARYSRFTGRRGRPVVAIFVAAFFAGCGNLTAGGYGDVEVYGSGDASEPTPAPGAARREYGTESPAGAPSKGPSIVGPLDGEMTVAVDAFLRTAGGAEYRLTPSGGVDLELDLADREDLVGARQAPTGAYEGVHVHITDTSAEVLSGLVIDGVPFFGGVDVDIGPAGLDVLLPLAFDLDEGETVALKVDFNAGQWLLTLELDILNPQRATVTAQAFADALTVALR